MIRRWHKVVGWIMFTLACIGAIVLAFKLVTYVFTYNCLLIICGS